MYKALWRQFSLIFLSPNPSICNASIARLGHSPSREKKKQNTTKRENKARVKESRKSLVQKSTLSPSHFLFLEFNLPPVPKLNLVSSGLWKRLYISMFWNLAPHFALFTKLLRMTMATDKFSVDSLDSSSFHHHTLLGLLFLLSPTSLPLPLPEPRPCTEQEPEKYLPNEWILSRKSWSTANHEDLALCLWDSKVSGKTVTLSHGNSIPESCYTGEYSDHII